MRWLTPWLVALVVAALAHVAVLELVPRQAMARTMQTLGQDGARLHRWIHAKMATPRSRTVVRPSPDLAYSLCIYDLAQGDLRLHVAPSPGYWSLSLYAANSDNYRVWNDQDTPQGVDVVLSLASGHDALTAPTSRGIAVVRRLVPDAAAWAQIEALRGEDQCESISAPATSVHP